MQTSEELTNLLPALLEFQKECPPIKKKKENLYLKSKYAPLDSVLEVVTPVLNKFGLMVVQSPTGTNQLVTTLFHTSGECLTDVYEMEGKNTDPQQQGSRITYQRRYAILALLGLAAEDEDDDGSGAGPTPDERLQELKSHLQTIATEEGLKKTSESFKKKYPELYKQTKFQKLFTERQKEIKG